MPSTTPAEGPSPIRWVDAGAHPRWQGGRATCRRGLNRQHLVGRSLPCGALARTHGAHEIGRKVIRSSRAYSALRRTRSPPLPTRVTRPRPPRLQTACRPADSINFHPQRCDTQRQSKTSRAPRTTHHRYRQICTPAPAVTANKELTPGRPLPPPRTAHHRNPVLCPLRSPAREGIGRSPRRDHAADPTFRKKTGTCCSVSFARKARTYVCPTN